MSIIRVGLIGLVCFMLWSCAPNELQEERPHVETYERVDASELDITFRQLLAIDISAKNRSALLNVADDIWLYTEDKRPQKIEIDTTLYAEILDHSMSPDGENVSVSVSTFHQSASDFVMRKAIGSDEIVFLRDPAIAVRGGQLLERDRLLTRAPTDRPMVFESFDLDDLIGPAEHTVTSLGGHLSEIDLDGGTSAQVGSCDREINKFIFSSSGGFASYDGDILVRAIEFITQRKDGTQHSERPEGSRAFIIRFKLNESEQGICVESFEILPDLGLSARFQQLNTDLAPESVDKVRNLLRREYTNSIDQLIGFTRSGDNFIFAIQSDLENRILRCNPAEDRCVNSFDVD